MHLIKLDATRSTNAFLKDLWQNNQLRDWTVVWAADQFGGRGQQGTTWMSEPGKNLTFSVLKLFEGLDIRSQFQLNMSVSLSVAEAMEELNIPQIRVKWPNDIMSGSHKICGVLIENIVKGSSVRAAILGIGLNVNQRDFPGLDQAGSMYSTCGKEFELDSVLQKILARLEVHLGHLNSDSFNHYRRLYESSMYRINQMSVFEFPDSTAVTGYIRGISQDGKLRVEIEGEIRDFDMKQISLSNST